MQGSVTVFSTKTHPEPGVLWPSGTLGFLQVPDVLSWSSGLNCSRKIKSQQRSQLNRWLADESSSGSRRWKTGRMMKAFCCRCRLVGPGALNLEPESCSSLQRTCLQCSTSCSGRMRLFWQFWKYVMTEVALKVVKVHWVPPTSYLTHSIVTGRMESHQSTHPFMHLSF